MRLILILSLLWATFAHALTVPEIVKKTKPACVTILVKDRSGKVLGHGSGFFYCDDVNFLGDAFAAVVTNYHVISVEGKVPMNGLTYEVVLPDGKTRYSTTFTLGDKKHDLALVLLGDTKASEHPYIHARFKNEPAKDVAEGDPIVVIGTPFDPRLFGTVSTGIVAGIRDNKETVQITAPVSPGSSGSPVMDEDGDLVGVAESIVDPGKGENINFAISAKFVVDLYDQYHNDFHKWEEAQRNAPAPTPTPESKDRPAPVQEEDQGSPLNPNANANIPAPDVPTHGPRSLLPAPQHRPTPSPNSDSLNPK